MRNLSTIYQNPAQIFGGECLFGGMGKLILAVSILNHTCVSVMLHLKSWEVCGNQKSI